MTKFKAILFGVFAMMVVSNLIIDSALGSDWSYREVTFKGIELEKGAVAQSPFTEGDTKKVFAAMIFLCNADHAEYGFRFSRTPILSSSEMQIGYMEGELQFRVDYYPVEQARWFQKWGGKTLTVTRISGSESEFHRQIEDGHEILLTLDWYLDGIVTWKISLRKSKATINQAKRYCQNL